MLNSFLSQYDSMDVIGNGSFGIIRKVRRKIDGLIFARKELNFERMSERDRKQIVAEVNILKDLHHDHIVRYHDRFVDREAGILYILMEYCGGGDLSTVIKQAMKHDRPIPEDTIWNYFMQILLALQHCHHPNGHGRSGSGGMSSGGGFDSDGKEKRAQILHRDLKPDNVFLDENNIVKLGDFGLSKALAQASFANTYVGTPYYMSPELMQEKAYDSKSDIWSLGCLIYELCALKPPFHEAKTHAELSILIRNGRVPPLPKIYSHALAASIKAMLNLNPAMRPSAAQLLQQEKIELVFKVSEAEKMLQTVKTHKATISSRERDVAAREHSLQEKERHFSNLLVQKDQEISALQQIAAQHQHCPGASQHEIELAMKTAIAQREDELRVLVMKREAEVATAMARREEEIIASVNQREEELCRAWATREQQMRQEVDDKIQELAQRELEIAEEEARLLDTKSQLEKAMSAWDRTGAQGKAPLEEVKNILAPVAHAGHPVHSNPATKFSDNSITPLPRTTARHCPEVPASAMKGVILTSTGEILATPTPATLSKLFVESPKVGLNFTNIFSREKNKQTGDDNGEGGDAASPPPSPTSRMEKRRETLVAKRGKEKENTLIEASSSSSKQGGASSAAPPTRIRRPSIRKRTPVHPSTTSAITTSLSDPTGLSTSSPSLPTQAKPLPHPHLSSHASTIPLPQIQRAHTSPEYDLLDEANLPSPFLKRTERINGVAALTKRPSNGNMLRAVAAANAAGRRTQSISTHTPDEVSGGSDSSKADAAIPARTESASRPSVASARKASEEARKALLR